MNSELKNPAILPETQVFSPRSDLPELPPQLRHLPIDERGYPVPWFVAWIDGKPEFRTADGEKRHRALRGKLCWVCGEKLGRMLAFVIGPMCAVNRISAEPPCHRGCAEYSLRACPFLSKPQMVRRENNLPEGIGCDGEMIRRNPGASILWMTRDYRLVGDGRGGTLLRLGKPLEVVAYSQGRLATHDELREAFESGLPILQGVADEQGEEANRELRKCVAEARQVLKIPALPAAAKGGVS